MLECRSPFPSPGDLSNPGIEPRPPALQAHIWAAREACLAFTLWLTIPVESAVCQGLQKILKMQKTDPCLVQSSHLACVREGVQSLVIHSCGFSFCMSVPLEVWLVPGEMAVRAGTGSGLGGRLPGVHVNPLGDFLVNMMLLVLSLI